MKSIEIDDEVYACLQSKAIPFVDTTPNDVLRREFGFKKKGPSKEVIKELPRTVTLSKNPKADLEKLVQNGLLQKRQKLTFNYKGKSFSKTYQAEIMGKSLLYGGQSYTMSKLTAEILEQEGLGIPSKSYRGPEFWCTSDGISVRQLWEQYLNNQSHKAICSSASGISTE